MHLSLSTAIGLLSLNTTSTALPFHLFGFTTAKASTADAVVRDTIRIPSISVLNYRIPEQRSYGFSIGRARHFLRICTVENRMKELGDGRERDRGDLGKEKEEGVRWDWEEGLSPRTTK